MKISPVVVTEMITQGSHRIIMATVIISQITGGLTEGMITQSCHRIIMATVIISLSVGGLTEKMITQCSHRIIMVMVIISLITGGLTEGMITQDSLRIITVMVIISLSVGGLTEMITTGVTTLQLDNNPKSGEMTILGPKGNPGKLKDNRNKSSSNLSHSPVSLKGGMMETGNRTIMGTITQEVITVEDFNIKLN
jgi:hypothetical protein